MSGESAENPDNIVDFPGKDLRPNPKHFEPVPEKSSGFFGWLKSLRRDKPLKPAETREEAKSRFTLVKPLDERSTNQSEDENSSGNGVA